MLNNRGFTLIETLFVLLIICMLSVLTLSFQIPQKQDSIMLKDISSFLRRAQMEAIVYKETVTIQFSQTKITWVHGLKYEEYVLVDGTSFENYRMTFNQYGHIKTAKTLFYQTSHKIYEFVYQIGNGCFYVR